MRTFAYVAVVLLATGVFVKKKGLAHSDRDHTAPRRAVIDASGARLVKVIGGAGELRVVAASGTHEVRVQGTAHASRSGGLKGIKLELRREGDEVTVRGVMPSGSGRRWFGGPTRHALDLVVEVPAGLEADVTDGSGDAEVEGVSALRLTDGSGELRISDVRGPVRVTDGSGELELSGIGGDLWLNDGSGNVTMRDIAGSLVVDADGSGELDVSNVQGDVLVRVDGSGDIDVSNVRGRFIVSHDGSGEVRHQDVKGGVQIPVKKAHRE
jgi:hypothetical protein